MWSYNLPPTFVIVTCKRKTLPLPGYIYYMRYFEMETYVTSETWNTDKDTKMTERGMLGI